MTDQGQVSGGRVERYYEDALIFAARGAAPVAKTPMIEADLCGLYDYDDDKA
jgi:hypothetical protein